MDWYIYIGLLIILMILIACYSGSVSLEPFSCQLKCDEQSHIGSQSLTSTTPPVDMASPTTPSVVMSSSPSTDSVQPTTGGMCVAPYTKIATGCQLDYPLSAMSSLPPNSRPTTVMTGFHSAKVNGVCPANTVPMENNLNGCLPIQKVPCPTGYNKDGPGCISICPNGYKISLTKYGGYTYPICVKSS